MSLPRPRTILRPSGPAALRLAAPALLLLGLGASTPAAARAAEAAPPDEGLHRGVGWYDADARVPEPPLALALVIVGAWAMRRRDRRLQARGAAGAR